MNEGFWVGMVSKCLMSLLSPLQLAIWGSVASCCDGLQMALVRGDTGVALVPTVVVWMWLSILQGHLLSIVSCQEDGRMET
jgi:hypothetical protein